MKKNTIVYEWGDALCPTKEGVKTGLSEIEYAYFLKYDNQGGLRIIRENHATVESWAPEFWEILPE